MGSPWPGPIIVDLGGQSMHIRFCRHNISYKHQQRSWKLRSSVPLEYRLNRLPARMLVAVQKYADE